MFLQVSPHLEVGMDDVGGMQMAHAPGNVDRHV